MLCGKSMICTNLTGSTTVSAGGIVPIGTVIRRFGNALRNSTNAITILSDGYYLVSVNIVAQPTGTGSITATLNANGVPVDGGVTTDVVATANNNTSFTLSDIPVRVVGGVLTGLNVTLSGEAVVTSSTITVLKV